MTAYLDLIEPYARSMMGEIAHEYEHADRVRRWALPIAQQEGYPHLDRIEAAALLHDIGLSHGRRHHAAAGAELATEFLRQHQLFSKEAIVEIEGAIRSHSSLEKAGALSHILRDADTLDLLGPVGIMRAFTSKSGQPAYPADNVKGQTWGISAAQISQRFAAGQGPGDYIVDQINFQISCYENLWTATARQLGRPLKAFMEQFLIELESQVMQDGTR